MSHEGGRIGEHYLEDVGRQLRKLKRMGETAASRLSDDEFFHTPDAESNSVALMLKHMAGNMRSRWTDFLTSDGEKPDRGRDREFELEPDDTRERILERWEDGWSRCIGTIDSLGPADLLRTVRIRGEPHTVLQAIDRQLTHYAYHVGQVVYLAKNLTGAAWESLSIPRGRSDDFEVAKGGDAYLVEDEDT